MKFQGLTDDEWEIIRPSIPPPAHTDRPGADDRSMISVSGVWKHIMRMMSDLEASRKLTPVIKEIELRTNRRPRKRPRCIWADNKYDTFIAKTYLAKNGVKAKIKKRSKKRKPGRRRILDPLKHKKTRSSVERFFRWLKSFRKIQTRYKRLASTFLGFTIAFFAFSSGILIL